jgi:hypothetical protein
MYVRMQIFWLPTHREAPNATHVQSSASVPRQITIIHCCESLDIKSNITAVVKGVQHMTSSNICRQGRDVGISVWSQKLAFWSWSNSLNISDTIHIQYITESVRLFNVRSCKYKWCIFVMNHKQILILIQVILLSAFW